MLEKVLNLRLETTLGRHCCQKLTGIIALLMAFLAIFYCLADNARYARKLLQQRR
jgi:hypothetical protein